MRPALPPLSARQLITPGTPPPPRRKLRTALESGEPVCYPTRNKGKMPRFRREWKSKGEGKMRRFILVLVAVVATALSVGAVKADPPQAVTTPVPGAMVTAAPRRAHSTMAIGGIGCRMVVGCTAVNGQWVSPPPAAPRVCLPELRRGSRAVLLPVPLPLRLPVRECRRAMDRRRLGRWLAWRRVRRSPLASAPSPFRSPLLRDAIFTVAFQPFVFRDGSLGPMAGDSRSPWGGGAPRRKTNCF